MGDKAGLFNLSRCILLMIGWFIPQSPSWMEMLGVESGGQNTMGSTQKPMRRRFEVQPGGGTLQGIHALGQASHKRGGPRGGFRRVDLGGV